MITVLAGTNREGSRTKLIADYIYGLLVEQAEEEVQFFSLLDLPDDMVHTKMYSEDGQSKALAEIQDEYMVAANKFYIVLPEYNGGAAGIFKLFIDACSVRKYNETFKGGKKAALTGVSAGRGGCSRGMEYMTGYLSYLGIHILPNRLPVSNIEQLVKEDELIDEGTQRAIQQQVIEFLEF